MTIQSSSPLTAVSRCRGSVRRAAAAVASASAVDSRDAGPGGSSSRRMRTTSSNGAVRMRFESNGRRPVSSS